MSYGRVEAEAEMGAMWPLAKELPRPLKLEGSLEPPEGGSPGALRMGAALHEDMLLS